MKLHENQELFKSVLYLASQSQSSGGLGISEQYLEKDYWICHCLGQLAASNYSSLVAFKGGTSLTKAYGIGHRFSEDIDLAVISVDKLSENQVKKILRGASHVMTQGLDEITKPGLTRKTSQYRKAYYAYPCLADGISQSVVKNGELLIELTTFADPFPNEKRQVISFVAQWLEDAGHADVITEYGMQPFELIVLDKRRTLTEKLVSLIRQSLSETPILTLKGKIRHFYDLYYLFRLADVQEYLHSNTFSEDFLSLLEHDQRTFRIPNGWQDKTLAQSPLLNCWQDLWQKLRPIYMRELPILSYRNIPSPTDIEKTMQELLEIIALLL